MIHVDGLTREFVTTKRDPGLRAALASVVRRRYRTITAVDDVSYEVGGGTVLGHTPSGASRSSCAGWGS